MSNFRGAIAIGSLLFTSSAMSVPVGPIEEIQLPAMLSFDYAAGMLGLVYGVDASTPDISATGRVTSSGFDWAVAGATYLGGSLDWSAAGVYDSTVHSIHWTGDGTYDGKTWTMTGDVEWLSGTEFRVRHAIDIAGVASAFTGVMGVPTSDSGFASDPPSKITYDIEKEPRKNKPPFSPFRELARCRSAVNHASPRSRLEEIRGFSGPFTRAGAPYRRSFAACASAGRTGSSASWLNRMEGSLSVRSGRLGRLEQIDSPRR